MSGKEPSGLESYLLLEQEPSLQENQNQRANPTRKNRSNEPSVQENQGQEPGIGANQKEKPAKRESHLGKPAQIETHQDKHQTEPLRRENHTIEQEPALKENQGTEPTRLENQRVEQKPQTRESRGSQPVSIENHPIEQEPRLTENHDTKRPVIDWYQMNLLCRSYLDIQQSRIALGHRNRLLFWEACYYLTYEPALKENQSIAQPEPEPKSVENQNEKPERSENQGRKQEPFLEENQKVESAENHADQRKPDRLENQENQQGAPNFSKARSNREPEQIATIAEGWGVDSEDVIKAIGSFEGLLKPQKDRKTGREIPPRFKFEQSKLEYWEGHGFKKPEISELLDKYQKSLLKNEKGEMLRDAEEMFAKSELWAWCERTRGLGPVAALTFMGYINPEKCATAGKFWAYCGYVPGAKMKSGERGNYNPELKGRFYVITRNVVMAQDPYYVALLNAKKQYYLTMRPDIREWEENKVKGWKGKVNNYALRWLTKLLQSHAIQILREENGLPFPKHHTFIPPKSADENENAEVLNRVVPLILKGVRD